MNTKYGPSSAIHKFDCHHNMTAGRTTIAVHIKRTSVIRNQTLTWSTNVLP